jgi:hypothetical protein
MSRRSLSILMLALIGTAGVIVWKSRSPAPVAAVTPAPSRRPLSPPPTPSPPPARLSFLTDLSQPYQVRISLLQNTLATECSEPELRYLYQLLGKAAATEEVPEQWYVIANDIMTQILSHETDAERFASRFTGLLSDPHQPEVLRDYAVQYLAAWLHPRSGQVAASSLASPAPPIIAQVLQSFAAAATDPTLAQTTIPGTTLMMLVDLSRSGNGVDCTPAITSLTPWLLHALEDGSTLGQSTRVSAVAAAGVLAPAEFRPTLRRIAFQENGSSTLRLPALAALGQSGEATDLPQLQQIAATHPELAYAAADACRVLSTRLAGTPPTISQ